MTEKYERSCWPADTAERIEKMRADDLPWRIVAESFGVDSATIRIKAQKLGVFRPSNRYFTAAEDDVIRSDYEGSVDLRQTALKLGRTYGDIRQRILRKHGDLVNGLRTAAGTKAVMRYGRDVLNLGATPAQAAEAVKAKIIAAKATARVAALQAKAKHNSQLIDLMFSQIAEGRDRNAAIFEARAMGVTLDQIGQSIGVTRERVRQICDAEAFRTAINHAVVEPSSEQAA